MATTTNHYDLIVIGSDIAGLVTAALCARRGKRVLVIPHGPADGYYRLAGRRLAHDTAPILHMGTPPVQRVFHELGLLQQVKRQHASVDELCHLVLPRQRLDLTPGGENFLAEAEREWPDDPVDKAWALQSRWTEATDEVLDQLLASDNALVADGFWGRRFLSRVAAQLPGDDIDELDPLDAEHPVRRASGAMIPWLQHLSPLQLGTAARLRLRGLWGAGPEDIPGGDARLRELLLSRIELHSGEVKRDLRVAEVLLKRGKVTGVSLLGKRDRYGCDHMVVATDPHRLLDGTFDPGSLPKPLLSTLEAIVPAALRFTMHVEIDERGLSPALAGMVVCVPEAPSEHGVGQTYIRLGPGANEGDRHLAITRIVEPDEALDDLRERILADLDERGVLPFCRPYVRLCHSPHDGREATDGEGKPREDVGPSAAMNVPMPALFAVHGEPSLGVGILPHASGLKALYFASRLTLPGLGLEGEFAAGTMAAGLIANPSRNPFSRSPLLSRA